MAGASGISFLYCSKVYTTPNGIAVAYAAVSSLELDRHNRGDDYPTTISRCDGRVTATYIIC